ncbi:trigger factor [Insolitispirillum peregrinum]|uniref:Trigger factor n=1 Tax=Insolitispirillum peregrinum TaxID=80876 RepID=A0A1N7IKX2_9PROT|nr:trigger factor [Insolitispirillum peregrinum]SIS37744.1 trigger factor [Insolitispirillum peregrinum]
MQVTETAAEGLKREFKIVVPAADIQAKAESRLQALSQQVRIPGFRPGKVPMPLMKQRYGASVLGEVLELAVQESADAALAERSLKPALQPKIEVTSFDEGKDLEYTLSVEILPEIAELDLKTVKLNKPKVVVADSEVEEALGRVAESRKVNVVVEDVREAVKGDVLEIDFVGSVDGVEFPGGKGEGYDLELGSGTFIPGFEDQLIGAKVGDVANVSVTFPEEYHSKDLAGKAAVFVVTVKALKAASLPALDDEFAKGLGLEDLDGLRNAIKGQIENEYSSMVRNRVKRDLLDALAEKADFPVPAGMVGLEFDAIWKQIEDAKKNDSLDEEDKGKSDDELKTEYTTLAERRVRLGLLLADLGQKNSVQVTQEDINRAVMQEAMRFPGQEQAVFQYFQNNRQALDSLRAPLYEDKVIDFILGAADVTEVEMTAEDLAKQDDAA